MKKIVYDLQLKPLDIYLNQGVSIFIEDFFYILKTIDLNDLFGAGWPLIEYEDSIYVLENGVIYKGKNNKINIAIQNKDSDDLQIFNLKKFSKKFKYIIGVLWVDDLL